MIHFKDTGQYYFNQLQIGSLISKCYYIISVDSVSFNAVDVTVSIRPNTRNSFFDPPPSLALDVFQIRTPTQTTVLELF